MNSTRALQLILPTDKRNSSFTLYQDDTEQRIHVYYGLELLQVVPADRQHVQHKLLVANLCNAGLKVTSLEDLFGVNRKTMRVWGQALQSGEVERLARALEGRRRHRKLTPEIRSFIQHRFADVYHQHRSRYNAQLRREVSVVFGVQLSAETIRPLLSALRAAASTQPGSPSKGSGLEAAGGVVAASGRGSEPGLPLAGEGVAAAGPEARTVENPCELAGEEACLVPTAPKFRSQ
jgi:transposase